MNDYIIKLEREAHLELVTKDYPGHTGALDPWTMQLLERYSDLIRANERDLWQDAERYRWLCEFRDWPASVEDAIDCGHKILIDEAIDAAIRARGQG